MRYFAWCFLLPLILSAAHSVENLPDWVLKRHSNYLPEYTNYVGKNASYLYTCSPLHCNAKGSCYVRDDIDQNGGKFCECSSSHFGPKCEFENACHNNPSFCWNYGTCKMVLEYKMGTTSEPTDAHPECECVYDTKGGRCEESTNCSNVSYCKHAKSCYVLDSGQQHCVCETGVSGEKCDQYESKSPCNEVDCGPGTCTHDSTTAACVCPDGLEGPRCDILSNVCKQIPDICGPHGKCQTEDGDVQKWSCECDQAWRGMFCDEVFKPCSTHSCLNGGKCSVEDEHVQKCICEEGFSGERCEQRVSTDCRKRECEHGGICSLLPDGSARCSCSEYWYGDFCENDVDECANDGPEFTCVNGATCRNMEEGYECLCMTGYTGFLCEIDEDDCLINNCMNGATCEDLGPSKFFCHCPLAKNGMPLFIGPLCSHRNPCVNESTEESMCENRGLCNIASDDLESYTCNCLNTGYKGKNCEEDVNECDEETYLQAGTHFSAHEDNRYYWPDIMMAVLDAFCIEVNFTKDKYDRYERIERLQDCEEHRRLNRTTNLCKELGHECVNEVGTWRCECSSDVSESIFCEVYTDICDHWRKTCKNGAICVNEFQVTGKQSDRPKLHECQCLPGFNGTYCEKDLSCSNIECTNGTKCFNDPKTGFGECKCPPGEKACESEEVRRSFVSCGEAGLECDRGSCVWVKSKEERPDFETSYKCECEAGFTGDRCELNINDCSPDLCKNGATCLDGVNDYFCSCKPGFEGKHCSIDVNECLLNYTNEDPFDGSIQERTGPCLNGGTCSDGINGYACTCPVGFQGKDCENVTDMCRGTEWQDVVCPGNTTERCLSQNINSNVFVTCVCKPGYFGEKCQHLWNPCDGPQEITENFHEQRKKHKVEVCENDGVCSPIYLNGKNGSHALDYRCDCRAGYTGRNCEKWTGECSADLCNQNGKCRVLSQSGDFACQCFPDFTGDRCSVVQTYAEGRTCKDYERIMRGNSMCQNGGTCEDFLEDGKSRAKCKCIHGYVGDFCEIPPEGFCNWKNPCKYGRCVNWDDSFKCECLEGYSGEFCDQVVPHSGCGNDCIPGITLCTHLPRHFESRCLFNNSVVDFEVPRQYSWYLCEPSWCGYGLFHWFPDVEIACVINVGIPKCICPSGKIGEYDCSVVKNLCETAEIKCNPEGTFDCITKDLGLGEPAEMECRCKPGFKGKLCEQINDVCDREGAHVCKNGGKCIPLAGNGFKCECADGYGCQDCSCSNEICESPEGLSFCNAHGSCFIEKDHNGTISRKCVCVDGVTADTCYVDYRNECDFNPCRHLHLESGLDHTCVDHFGFYECIGSTSDTTSTLTPLATKSPYSQKTPTLIESLLSFKFLLVLGSIVCTVLLLLLVLKGATGTKIVVQKTYYPSGWLEAIRSYKESLVSSASSNRKRKRDDPAGQYEMGSTTEGDYYCSEYSEIESSSKRFRPKLESPQTAPNAAAAGKSVAISSVDGGHSVGSTSLVGGIVFPSPPPITDLATKRMAAGVDNTTPAMLILQNRNVEVRKHTLKEMVEAGYDMNTQNLSRHETVLHQAILHCDIECVRILLQSPSIDLSISDINNRNAVMTAVTTSNEPIFELVCCHSTREMLNQQQDDGSTALMAAAKFLHSTAILRRLIEIGVDVNTCDKRGRSALHWAAQVGNHEAVVLLLQAKADKDAQDNEECTPLMHAVRDGCDECVLKLLELGADRTIENRDRETALDIAKDYQNMRIIHYLENVLSIMAPMDGNGKKVNRKVSKAKQKKEPKRRCDPNFTISPTEQNLMTAVHVQNAFSPRLPPHLVSPPTAVFTPVNGHVAFTQASNVQLNPTKVLFNSANVHFTAPNFLSPIERNSTSSLKREKSNGAFLITPAPIAVAPQGNVSHPSQMTYPCLNPNMPQSVLNYPPPPPSLINTTTPNSNVTKLSNIQTQSSCSRVNDVVTPGENGSTLPSIQLPQKQEAVGSNSVGAHHQNEFAEDWSSTIPAIQVQQVVKNESGANVHGSELELDRQSEEFAHQTAGYGVHAYEKVNYGYACLPKVTATVFNSNTEAYTSMSSRILPATPTFQATPNGSTQNFNESNFNNNSRSVPQNAQTTQLVSNPIPTSHLVAPINMDEQKMIANNGYLNMSVNRTPNSNYFQGPGVETSKIAPNAETPNLLYQQPRSEFDFDNPIYQPGSTTSTSNAVAYFHPTASSTQIQHRLPAAMAYNNNAHRQQHGALATHSVVSNQVMNYNPAFFNNGILDYNNAVMFNGNMNHPSLEYMYNTGTAVAHF